MKNKKKLNFRKILNLVINLFAGKNKKSFSSLIYHITETYEKDGLINHEEKHMFRNMVNFGDKKVSTIMVPSSDIICISEDISLNEIKKIITEDEHTRIPVYRDNIDHIVGFIHSQDLAKFL
ncbi:MAG: CBS domain-containing protein, partial [Alphaproteobacteria bacterium]